MEQKAQDELYKAVSDNDIASVLQSLQNDVDINNVCSNGLTPLGAAAYLGNEAICEKLIENYKRTNFEDGASISKKKRSNNDMNQRPHSSQKNIGYFVVKKDIDVEQKTDDELTPEGMELLEWDAEIPASVFAPKSDAYSGLYRWYADILDRTSDILRYPFPCDINQLDSNGRTALHYACNRGHRQIVRMLLNAGCNVNRTAPDDVTPLHLATHVGDLEIVRLLLEAGADVNRFSYTKTTPLHIAAAQGHLDVMELLLQVGANLEATDFRERTPLAEAVSVGNSESVKLLVNHGSRINIEYGPETTPLCEAVWINAVGIVETLINAGAKLTQSHHLLHHAVINNYIDMCKLLVKAGSIVNLRNDSGCTPLMIAAQYGFVEVAKYLLEQGAMVNLTNSLTGQTALYAAVDNLSDEDIDVVSPMLHLLVSHGANLEHQSMWDTPLFRAIFNDEPLIAGVLIQLGSDVNFYDPRLVVDNMYMARKNKFDTVVKMLVYAGYNLNNLSETRATGGSKISPDPISQWVNYMKCNPMSLMALCRLTIRKSLGKMVYTKISHLGLPPRIKKYLQLEIIE